MPTAKRLYRLVTHDRLDEARAFLASADPSVISEPLALRARALLAEKENRLDDAVDAYRAVAEQTGDETDAVRLGVALLTSERYSEAHEIFRRWAERQPDNAGMWSGVGDSLAALGRVQESREALRRAVTLDPDSGGAWYVLTTLGDYDWLHERRDTLLAACDPRRDIVDRAAREFAAGRYLEKSGEWEAAFERLKRGNDLRRRRDELHIGRKIEASRLVMDDWDRQDLSAVAGCHAEPAPIFIIGMPRSGTSLVEQILDSHPDVHAIGERRYLKDEVGATVRASRAPIAELDWRSAGERYLERVRALTGDTRHITDKMMLNFNIVGFIRLMFDNVRIVHCRRDALDTCVSCYRTSFKETSLSYSLRELGQFQGFYESFMAFWQARFGEIFVNVQYEDLVSDPPDQVARLLESLGLPWSDRCLDYHDNRRIVATASMQQVRRKPYKTSIGRAEPYRKYLGPLIEGMEDARARMARAGE